MNRDWIQEFAPSSPADADHAPLVREFVIQERAGNWYDVFQTYPERRLLCRLGLDECIGALAIALTRGTRWQTPEGERAWLARYEQAAPRVLEPWEKQLTEKAGA